MTAQRKPNYALVAILVSAFVAMTSAWWTISTHMIGNLEDKLARHEEMAAHAGAQKQLIALGEAISKQRADTAALSEAMTGVRDALRELRAELRAWRSQR